MSESSDRETPNYQTPNHKTPKPKPTESSSAKSKAAKKDLAVVGWQEWVVLPSLANSPIRAKIDTGAASSSVHASKVVVAHDPFGREVASFDLHLDEDRTTTITIPRHHVHDTRVVRSSSGHWSARPVLTVPLQIGNFTFDVDVTLAARDPMEYRMLIGRSALRKRFFVDTSKSFLLGEPQ